MKIIERKFLNVTTPSCHAGTMAFYKNEPVYAWFGGVREGSYDCSIYIQCKDKIHIIGNQDLIPRWNPILFSHNGQLYLFVKSGLFCDRWATQIYNISDILNDDFTIEEAKCQILPAGLNGAVKSKPIVYKGLVYCGSSVENILDWSAYCEIFKVNKGVFEYVDRSRPLVVPKKIYNDAYFRTKQTMGIIQPSLWKDNLKQPTLHAFFRSSYGLGKIYYAFAHRNTSGYWSHWSNPVATNLDNPNSGSDTVYIDGHLFLAHNPSSVNRYPLVISELDENFNIRDQLVVQEKVEGRTNTAELSYPYLVSDGKNVYCTYTYGRSKIETVTLEI